MSISHDPDMPPPRHILITGASGGLGTALARHYAGAGRTLSLWARDPALLEIVAAATRERGAKAHIRALDLTDTAAAIAAIEAEDSAAPIDLAIFAAGLGDILTPGESVEDPARVARLGLVNFVAPSAMAAAVAGRMAERGQGCIVLVGSAAAFHPLPFAAAYAGSKAGLARFADALRIGVARRGVHVLLVSPGFIDTAAGRRTGGPKPFLMQPDAVAARIARAAERRQAHLVLPWPFRLLRWIELVLPGRLRDRLLRGLTPPTA